MIFKIISINEIGEQYYPESEITPFYLIYLLDIDNLVEWSREWLMRLNEGKCKVMHIGKENQQYPYTINTSQNVVMILSKTTLERDLGEIIYSFSTFEHFD